MRRFLFRSKSALPSSNPATKSKNTRPVFSPKGVPGAINCFAASWLRATPLSSRNNSVRYYYSAAPCRWCQFPLRRGGCAIELIVRGWCSFAGPWPVLSLRFLLSGCCPRTKPSMMCWIGVLRLDWRCLDHLFRSTPDLAV